MGYVHENIPKGRPSAANAQGNPGEAGWPRSESGRVTLRPIALPSTHALPNRGERREIRANRAAVAQRGRVVERFDE